MKDLEKIRKRMMLNYLISQLFAQEIDLGKELEVRMNIKEKEDPFTLPKQPLPEQQADLKPLKFLQKFDGERFKALKNKAIKQEMKEELEVEDSNNAET